MAYGVEKEGIWKSDNEFGLFVPELISELFWESDNEFGLFVPELISELLKLFENFGWGIVYPKFCIWENFGGKKVYGWCWEKMVW